ncbi:MAG: peptidylprolyl isomerase [Paucibacter sp.]|nr:peptidylprolyl isomerase [Roseateles sp.]
MSNQQGCGSGSCGCASTAASTAATIDDIKVAVAMVNGVPLHGEGESPDPEALRQRAYSELLRQAAQRRGLLAVGDLPALDGVLSEAASDATLALLERELQLPEPDDRSCRRYFDAHPARYHVGEKVLARHILFAVTPGINVPALRQRAEGLLVGLRCEALDSPVFAQAAADNSNCPSGAEGGDLGWLEQQDCAPEFRTALFAQDEANAHIGVLPRLISTRFGFHIVQVQAREAGVAQSFESVKGAIAQLLRQQAYMTALRQYLSLLAGEAELSGIELDAADSPLLQ